MGNNVRVFPPYFPESCPPAEASGEEIVLFRLCKEITPSAEDFLTFYQINPQRYAGLIQAYGLSMFPSAEDCEHAKRKSPRLRGTHKGIAYGQVDAGKGKILRTPSKANPAHITWWIYEGVEPHTFFTAYGKGGVESE